MFINLLISGEPHAHQVNVQCPISILSDSQYLFQYKKIAIFVEY